MISAIAETSQDQNSPPPLWPECGQNFDGDAPMTVYEPPVVAPLSEDLLTFEDMFSDLLDGKITRPVDVSRDGAGNIGESSSKSKYRNYIMCFHNI